MPPSRRPSSSHRSSSHRSSSHRPSSSHRSSSHRSSSSYRSSSLSSFSHHSGYHSHRSGSSGLIGLLFGLDSMRNSSRSSYDSTYTTNSTLAAPAAPVSREYVCRYCDNTFMLSLTGSESIVCPVCGAPVSQSDIADMRAAAAPTPVYNTGMQTTGGTVRRRKFSVVKVLVIAVIVIALYNAARSYVDRSLYNSGDSSGGSYASANEDSIYVPALSRTVYWNDEYNSYYDQPTDCYFFKNEDIDPAEWEYWYEGISSDYGEDGWMEWDEAEKRWYINTSGDNWIVLPSKYDTSRLWHF